MSEPPPNLPPADSADSEDALFERVYNELRALARQHMRHERPDHTLQATALVSEAWLRLRDDLDGLSSDRGRFFLAAAESMRRILIEHARRRGRQKRGGDLRRLPLDVLQVASSADLEQVLAIDTAIEELKGISARAASLVRLRFFAGLTEAEAASAMGISERTARREWSFVRAWLFLALAEPD